MSRASIRPLDRVDLPFPSGCALARTSTIYVCDACHGQTPKWQGQCPHCGEWNSLTAQQQAAGSRAVARSRPALVAASGVTALSAAIAEGTNGQSGRLAMGLGELDRVLGRRACSRVGHLAWRRARNRQVHLVVAGGAGAGSARAGVLCNGRGVHRADCLARSQAGWRLRTSAAAGRDRSGHRARAGRTAAPGAACGGFHPDHGAGCCTQRRRRRDPVARVHRCAGAIRQVEWHGCVDRGPRHQGWAPLPARACSSIWSTRCSISNAMRAAASVACVRPRTASAPPMSSASS